MYFKNVIFVAKMYKYGIFVAKICIYGIFVAKICKYGIFVTKTCKYAFNDSFFRFSGFQDSAASLAALIVTMNIVILRILEKPSQINNDAFLPLTPLSKTIINISLFLVYQTKLLNEGLLEKTALLRVYDWILCRFKISPKRDLADHILGGGSQ